jgi:hypothetical protein
MRVADKDVKISTVFSPAGKFFVQENFPNLTGTEIEKPVYWDGLVKEEDRPKWTAGPWKQVEIKASHFNQRGRWYDVPAGQVIRGLALERDEFIILKLLTRESKGSELKVQNRFALLKSSLLKE